MEIEEVRMRYMIRRDMPAVLRIENEGSEHPWREGDFLAGLRQHACIGIVAEASAQVVGFMLYELYPSRLYILNLAVAKEVRRRGVGSELVSHMIRKLYPGGRNRLMLEVRESNLAAQVFLRTCGFRAVSILPEFYDDSSEDAYLMQLDYLEEAGVV